jgi:tetratricopeptide (TPR) repeat protein
MNAYNQYFSGNISQAIWDKMMDILLRAIEVDPENKDAHLMLGKIYEDIAGVWERRAIKEPAEKDHKKHATSFYKAAINEYLEVLKRDPKNEIIYSLVEVCFKLEEYKVALEALKNFITITQDLKAKSLLRMVELKIREKGK